MAREDGRQPRSFRTELEAVVRDNLPVIHLLMIVCTVLLALSVFSLAFIDRESASFVVLQFNFVMLTAFLVVLGGLSYRYSR
ncbi:hypothetical protein AB7C87_17765 [Natrarchaeobius sp. A-rgal3]|uniref:hypothetical protein n=1 Tax=Natrarchaeobius versutus TaxID=1679078 RepID=UPI00350EA15E